MIWDLLVDLVVGFLLAVLDLFPIVNLDGLAGFGVSIGSGLATANTYFPVGLLGVCLGVVLAVRLGLIGWQFVMFVYRNFPGKAT